MKQRYVVGIDPGEHTGVAVYDRDYKQFLAVRTMDFWTAFEFVTANYEASETLLVIENGSLNKFTNRQYTEDKSSATGERISRNVGMNNRESDLLIEGLRRQGFEVREFKPISGNGKWSPDQARRYTGYTGRTNEHVRDAMRLAFIYI